MAASTTRPIALITGANQGIGLAVAHALATQHSYHVIVGSRRLEAGEKAVNDLKELGHGASAIQLDLMSLTSIENAVRKIEQDFGYLDVLINSAGILKDLDPSYNSTWDLFDQTFKTNVTGPATLTEGLLPLLRKSKAGPPRLVFVSSVMGSLERSTDRTTMYYNIDYKAYDASKAAVNMLMLNYVRNLGDSAKVNSVCPGYAKTALTGFTEYGHSPEVGAERIVELATLDEHGPTGTFSDRNGSIPW